MLRVFWLLLVLPVAAQADELPKNLLLKCEGKESVILGPETLYRPFSSTLRLKDGTIGDIDSPWPDGNDCVLSNGTIRCELNYTSRYDPTLNVIGKRHGIVSIVRETGEYTYLLEIWEYPGKTVSGKSPASTKMRRTGVCRPVSSPVF